MSKDIVVILVLPTGEPSMGPWLDAIKERIDLYQHTRQPDHAMAAQQLYDLIRAGFLYLAPSKKGPAQDV